MGYPLFIRNPLSVPSEKTNVKAGICCVKLLNGQRGYSQGARKWLLQGARYPFPLGTETGTNRNGQGHKGVSGTRRWRHEP